MFTYSSIDARKPFFKILDFTLTDALCHLNLIGQDFVWQTNVQVDRQSYSLQRSFALVKKNLLVYPNSAKLARAG